MDYWHKVMSIFSSCHELTQSRGVRRLSVCKLLRKSLLLEGKWPDRHQTCTRWTPGQCASRVCSRSRSRDTGTFVLARKSLLLAGKRPDRHQTCTWWTCASLMSCILDARCQRASRMFDLVFLELWPLNLRVTFTNNLQPLPVSFDVGSAALSTSVQNVETTCSGEHVVTRSVTAGALTVLTGGTTL